MLRTGFVLTLALAALPAVAEDTPSWRDSALALVPAGYVAGEAYATEKDTMTGYIAVYPVGADNPKTPGSSFAPRQALAVRLVERDGRLQAVSADLTPRSGGPRGNRDTTTVDKDEVEDDYLKLEREMLAKAKSLPPGTEPCDLGAWNEDRDPKGLNVRAEPSTTGKVLGTLSPPFKLKNIEAEQPEEGYHTEFRIIGFKDGWFLIENAKPPGKDYQDERTYPKKHPKPYPGRGWVHASKVGASFANGDHRSGGLFQAPHVDAKWTPAQRKLGGPLDADGGPKRIHACSGFWALVESEDGVIGWWRRLCSSQVTTCS
jgi:hypothetical protein